MSDVSESANRVVSFLDKGTIHTFYVIWQIRQVHRMEKISYVRLQFANTLKSPGITLLFFELIQFTPLYFQPVETLSVRDNYGMFSVCPSGKNAPPPLPSIPPVSHLPLADLGGGAPPLRVQILSF